MGEHGKDSDEAKKAELNYEIQQQYSDARPWKVMSQYYKVMWGMANHAQKNLKDAKQAGGEIKPQGDLEKAILYNSLMRRYYGMSACYKALEYSLERVMAANFNIQRRQLELQAAMQAKDEGAIHMASLDVQKAFAKRATHMSLYRSRTHRCQRRHLQIEKLRPKLEKAGIPLPFPHNLGPVTKQAAPVAHAMYGQMYGLGYSPYQMKYWGQPQAQQQPQKE